MKLETRGILVTLTQRAWKATATDRELAEATEQAAHAETGTMRVIKELTPKDVIQPIKYIMSVGRSEHYNMTVPGLMRGQQLLASAMFYDYLTVQKEIESIFLARVNHFLEIYPAIIEAAPARIGSGYKVEDFPSVNQIRSYFEYKYTFIPVPTIDDWRLEGLASVDQGNLKIEIEDQVKVMYNRATREMFDRAKEILTRVAKQAREYTGGPGSAQLRDATIENLKEMANLVVKMNVTDDPELSRIGYEMIEAFADEEGQKLRQDQTARERIAAAAERIAARIT
jgi:hypothetical protein